MSTLTARLNQNIETKQNENAIAAKLAKLENSRNTADDTLFNADMQKCQQTWVKKNQSEVTDRNSLVY